MQYDLNSQIKLQEWIALVFEEELNISLNKSTTSEVGRFSAKGEMHEEK